MQIDIFKHLDRGPTQLDIFESPKSDKFEEVEAFFASIKPEESARHIKLWEKLSCRNEVDRFLRWIFAFCSVHTTYENNMRGYLALRNWTEWFNRPDKLRERIEESRIGLHEVRTKGIMNFAVKFWNDPSEFARKKGETWVQARNRIVENVHGLAKAKVSFALEMTDMMGCEVFCADVHLFRFYGLSQNKDLKRYEEIEKHWVQFSKIWNVPSPIARGIYWNRNKGQLDCSYWANVFCAK